MAIRVEKASVKGKVGKPDQPSIPQKKPGKGVTGKMAKRAALGTSATSIEHARLSAGDLPAERVRKEMVTLRLDADVLDAFRAGGPGWQTRINDVLRGHMPVALGGTRG